MATIAITGITGLVGGHVGYALRDAGHEIVGISRGSSNRWADQALRAVPDLTDADALAAALQGCDFVFHFADRANRASYREQDVDAAAAAVIPIREACARNGIERLVVASSVYADREDRHDDFYGRSKRAMEAAALLPMHGVRPVILRLPPLHGSGARGAVRHIANAVEKGWPLPFSMARAPRRFLSLDALADLCVHLVAVDHAVFARVQNRILFPVNTRQGSLKALVQALGKGRTRLLPVPGIDRLVGGQVSSDQLERDRDALLDTIGWQARD